MKKKVMGFAFIAALVTVTFYACSKNSSDGSPEPAGPATDTFKTALLTNYANNLIIPAYSSFQQQLIALESSANAFLAAPTTITQQSLKISFRDSYLGYQKVSLLFFGPAGATQFNNSINSFPCTVAKIESGITTGVYNLAAANVSDSIQGFPALDYLFFSTNAVQNFAGANAANRKKYVQDVISRMKSLTDNVLTQWKTTYSAPFIANTKLDVGSSMGYLVNQFAYEMDQLKGPRIGWPFGKQSDGIVFADKSEGFYGDFSAALAIANLTSVKNYYTGGNERGIDDYLVLLQKSALNISVIGQFDVTLTALKAIPEPMSASFSTNKPLIENAYKQVQKLLTLIKTDVASATSIRITYQDTDGD